MGRVPPDLRARSHAPRRGLFHFGDPMSLHTEDLRWMRRCLELAARGGRAVQPNPRVGAVLVKHGLLIGEGWHRRAGDRHAEREALESATADPHGATLYVSLEPCHLQGRTPPCTDAILDAGIARVVYAMEDPNPDEMGRSAALLRERGLRVDGGLLGQEARALNPEYLSLRQRGRPIVLLKSAGTLNGMLARADGSSRWVTGPESREEVHRLRASVGGVMVGAETARRDRPALDLRLIADEEAPPRPIVVEGAWPVYPEDLDWRGREPIVVAPERADLGDYERGGFTVLRVAEGEQGVDVEAALRALALEGLGSVMVEGGGRLLSSFLAAGLWERWEHFMAPRFFPADGRPLWTRSADGPGFRLAGLKPRGADLQISLVPEGGE